MLKEGKKEGGRERKKKGKMGRGGRRRKEVQRKKSNDIRNNWYILEYFLLHKFQISKIY